MMEANHPQERILSIQNVVIQFTLRGQVLTAIRDISLDLYKGESLAIVGESGSGKSVLVKSIMGLLDKNGYIDKGQILYNDMDLARFKTEEDWLKIRGKEIAMVTQDPMTSLNPLKTIGKQIEECVVLHQGLRGKDAYHETLKLLTDVGIYDVEKRYKQYPHEFSGGMRQRIVIAIALACNPKILICDEPTGNLDSKASDEIVAILKKTNKELNQTIIMITHNMEIAKCADRIIKIEDGHIVSEY